MDGNAGFQDVGTTSQNAIYWEYEELIISSENSPNSHLDHW